MNNATERTHDPDVERELRASGNLGPVEAPREVIAGRTHEEATEEALQDSSQSAAAGAAVGGVAGGVAAGVAMGPVGALLGAAVGAVAVGGAETLIGAAQGTSPNADESEEPAGAANDAALTTNPSAERTALNPDHHLTGTRQTPDLTDDSLTMDDLVDNQTGRRMSET